MAHLHTALQLLSGDDTIRATVTRSRLERMLTRTEQLRELRIEIDTLVRASGSTLPEIYGVGPIVAATIVGHVFDVRRYPTRHHFATANGTAPIPASSGAPFGTASTAAETRQLNCALYTIAITQIPGDTEARAYYRRKRAEGKTSREALRCLKRRLSDLIYRTLRSDLAGVVELPSPLLSAA